MKLLLILLTLTNFTYAGTETHGGDVIACYDRELYLDNGKIDHKAQIVGHPELKDFWEHSQLSFFELDIDNKQTDYKSILQKIMSRLQTIHPELGNELSDSLTNIEKKMKFITRSIIADIDDSPSDIIPDAGQFCYERQVAFHIDRPRVGGAIFYVDKHIFNKMLAKDQAGLMMHEFLIEQFKEVARLNSAKFDDTNNVRYFNFMISSNFMDQTKQDFINQYSRFLFESDIIKRNTENFTLNFFDEISLVFTGAEFLSLGEFGYLYARYNGETRIVAINGVENTLKTGDVICIGLQNNFIYLRNNCGKDERYAITF